MSEGLMPRIIEAQSEGWKGDNAHLLQTDFADPGRIYRFQDGTLEGDFEISGEKVVLSGLEMNVSSTLAIVRADIDSSFPKRTPILSEYTWNLPDSN